MSRSAVYQTVGQADLVTWLVEWGDAPTRVAGE